MIQDRPLVVLALCLVAIVVGAALFPAAGMDGGAVETGDRTDGPVGSDEDATTDDGHGEGSDGSDDPDAAADDPSDDGGASSDAADGVDDSSDSDGTTDDRSTDGNETGTDADETADDGGAGSTLFGAFLVEVVGLIALLGVSLLVSGRVWERTDPTRADGITAADLPDRRSARLALRIQRLPQATMFATIAAARYGTTVGSGVAELGATAARGVGHGWRSLRATGASIRLPSLPSVSGLWRLSLRWPSFGWNSRTDRTRSATGPTRRTERSNESQPTPSAEPPREPESVAAAWERIVASLSLRRASVRTPRECAVAAVDAGMPEDAVITLTETFERVRYGGASETAAQLERARAAYQRIREETGGDRQ
ncbi:DUF4129 domain-containing protein [Halovivax gelatinilyticus]|uniref:DUF4129 domain-containing protein n=1 Tax=Halovivax gelatinilyticus TaxID=2961597 RepID=UPI0020CA8510|nr:DUF4129 domain-containing protein [Halovivax gelatinilyticus]